MVSVLERSLGMVIEGTFAREGLLSVSSQA